MIEITEKSKWGANAKAINFDIFSQASVPIQPHLFHKAQEIVGDNNIKMGLCLRGEDIIDINIYLSIILKVQTTHPAANFYVSCDDSEIINYLADKTTVPDKEGRFFCPIYPNYLNDEYSEEDRFIVDLICLKQVENIFSTPFNDYAFKMASIIRKGVYIPNEEEVYVLGSMDLARM